MSVQDEIHNGRRPPDVTLCEMIDGELSPITTHELLGAGRVLVIGVPGAFTPICTGQHVAGLMANADRLRESGIDTLICIATSDPFSTDAWRQHLDPEGKVRFISDGNLDFARGLGLVSRETELFLGDRSARYLLMLQDGVITTMRVEDSVLDHSCTRADAFVLDEAA